MYYKDGSIYVRSHFSKGVKEGMEYSIERIDGRKRYCVVNYTNNKRDGVYTCHSKEEKKPENLEAIVGFLNGDRFGGQTYFKAPFEMKDHMLYSKQGKLGELQFDEATDSVWLNGAMSFMYYNKLDLKMGEPFRVAAYIGRPIIPIWHSSLKVSIFDSVGTRIDAYEVFSERVHNCDQFLFDFEPEKKGPYQLGFYYSLFSEPNDFYYADTSLVDVVFR